MPATGSLEPSKNNRFHTRKKKTCFSSFFVEKTYFGKETYTLESFFMKPVPSFAFFFYLKEKQPGLML